jgi:LSD1 subclass zinc finger protein
MSEPLYHPISKLSVYALVLFAAFTFVQARACNQIHPMPIFIICTLTLACLSQRSCPNCTTSLIFPVHVQNVQCGRCGFNTVFLPQQRRNESQIPDHRLLTCTSCRTTISFPSGAPAVKSVHAVAILILASQLFVLHYYHYAPQGAVFAPMSRN